MKLFADLERRRRQLEQRISDEAARKRESELEAEEKRNVEKEFAKNWEESRQGRVNSWLNFKWGKTTPSSSATPPAASPSQPPLPPGPPPPLPPSHAPRFAPASAPKPPLPSAASFSQPQQIEKKKKKKEKRFSPMGFRPPKHKPESR